MTTTSTVALAKDGPLLSRVEDLIPTQSRVGFQEVERKAEKIRDLNKEDRHEYLRKNPVPVVIGPFGSLYIIDHHHLARAVLDAGHSKIYITVIKDKSYLSESAFWYFMKSRRWIYLRDDVNGKTLNPSQLPKRIKDMEDDSFRSLAGQLRRARGFIKSESDYFIEFTWAQKLREHFSRIKYPSRSSWQQKDIDKAFEFAISNEAIDLPGSLTGNKCEALFR